MSKQPPTLPYSKITELPGHCRAEGEPQPGPTDIREDLFDARLILANWCDIASHNIGAARVVMLLSEQVNAIMGRVK